MNHASAPRSLVALVYLYVACLPLLSVSILNVGGRGLGRLDWVMGAMLCAAFCVYWLLGKMRLSSSHISTCVLIYLCTVALNLCALFDTRRVQLVDYVTVAAQQLLVGSVFFAISSLPVTQTQLKGILRVWFLVAFAVALYGLYQLPARLYDWPFAYVTLTDPRTAPGGMQTGRTLVGFSQISSVLREPTWLGSYLQGPIVLFGVILLEGRARSILFRSDLTNRACLLVMILALVASVALGTYVAFLSIVFVVFISNRRLRGPVARVALLLLAVLIVTGGLLSSTVGIEFLSAAAYRVRGLLSPLTGWSGGATSFATRMQRAKGALQVWATHPFVGVGINNTHYYSAYENINSGWIKLMSTQGLMGVLAMSCVLLSALYGLRKMTRLLGLESWFHPLLVGLFYLVISDSIDTMVTFDWASSIRWFTISLANLVFIRSRASLSHVAALQMTTSPARASG